MLGLTTPNGARPCITLGLTRPKGGDERKLPSLPRPCGPEDQRQWHCPQDSLAVLRPRRAA